MTTGVWVLLGALVLATALGLGKRWYDGRFRAVALGRRASRTPAATSTDPTAAAGGAAAADGAAAAASGGAATDDAARLCPADIDGVALGERATLVQFSSAFCQPCRATRRILADVAEIVPGVAHVDIDAESHLDLVRRLDVRRTPTTLVLDADGRVTTRASGQPRKEQVLAALPG